MNASPNLTDPYDPMAGTLAGSYARAGTFQDEPFPPLGVVEHGAPTVPDVPGDVPALNVNILALDLGTRLGWALQMRGRPITHGTESFTPRKSWSPGQRWQRFRTFLHEVVAHNNVHVIAYEDVKRHAGTDAAHAYGAFLALTELVADSHRVRLVPVGVGTIKKHWTGKGNADKAAMEAQARARGFRPESDNDADALAILHWAVAQERKA
ncbi:hypothetical protein LMG26841_05183 [Achromobacter dolens]|uniref:Holliday junction resolvase RuvC n=1 Tax=Achromobacter dolens TaxID=1287738 RepID=A0A6S7ELS6_9BURK|nr:hypothetical protein [Achromobacter dolens]CAB3914642.1 hypothetical protein LMG26841_05183 [Achromobacter dolens]